MLELTNGFTCSPSRNKDGLQFVSVFENKQPKRSWRLKMLKDMTDQEIVKYFNERILEGDFNGNINTFKK